MCIRDSSYPLHAGRVDGDRIVCGYHGFEYGADGRCAWIPSLQMASPNIRVQAYPTKEVGPFIWLWTGDPDAVDESRFIDQPWFYEPGWRWVNGYFHMKANYLGLHENLFDTSHFPFLHGAVLGRPDHAVEQPQVKRGEDNVVTLEILHRDVPVARRMLDQSVSGLARPINRLSQGRVEGPAMHVGTVTYMSAANPTQSFITMVIHATTPESQGVTHYYWATSRNIALEDEIVQADSYKTAYTAFEQDKVALEEIEAMTSRDKRPDFRERIIATDRGSVQILRAMAQRAAEEDATRAAEHQAAE